jgi:hypothetical protein
LPIPSKMVFRKGLLHADLYTSTVCSPSKTVVVTFTERCNRSLTEPGFGTEFLLSEGFDVLAVRNAEDDWYAKLGLDELQLLRGALEPYRQRATYGSSMGAFAAVKFAGALKAKRAVAISPVLDITADWDTRYRSDIHLVARSSSGIEGGAVGAADISPTTYYHVAVDPLCREDMGHVRRLCEMASGHSLLKIPLGGHPVGPAMRDAGILRSYVIQAITSDALMTGLSKTPKDARKINTLARHLLDRGKLKIAKNVNKSALDLEPGWGEAHLLQAQILHRLGFEREMGFHGRAAIRLEPRNPYVVEIVGRMLMAQGEYEEARRLVQSAIERLGPENVLVAVLDEVELLDGKGSADNGTRADAV